MPRAAFPTKNPGHRREPASGVSLLLEGSLQLGPGLVHRVLMLGGVGADGGDLRHRAGEVEARMASEVVVSAVLHLVGHGVGGRDADGAVGFQSIGTAVAVFGDGEQGLALNGTNMIFSYGNKWEPYNEVVDPTSPTNPVDPTQSITVFFDNSSSNFATPYIYYWVGATDVGEHVWPGVAMTKFKDNVWMATIPKENDMCIFSNNGGSQTDNLNIPGDDYIFGYYDRLEDAEFVRNFLMDHNWNVNEFNLIEFDEDTDTYRVVKVIDDKVYVLGSFENENIDLNKTYEEVLEGIKERHRLETEREIAPLVQAPDAVYIDSTGMTIEEEVQAVIEVINEKRK